MKGSEPRMSTSQSQTIFTLFGWLRRMFIRPQERTGGDCECAENNLRTTNLVRQLIRQQDPLVRSMIFLRHGDGLPLEQVAVMTQESAEVVKSRLLEFRKACRTVLSQRQAATNFPIRDCVAPDVPQRYGVPRRSGQTAPL